MPRVRSAEEPRGSPAPPNEERAYASLPIGDAPHAHYRATQLAMCHRRLAVRDVNLQVYLNPDGSLYVCIGVLIPELPSVRSHLHHVSIGEVRPTARLDLIPLLAYLQNTVDYRRGFIPSVLLRPLGRSLHYEIPPGEPLAQLAFRLRANLLGQGFSFGWQPEPHISWL